MISTKASGILLALLLLLPVISGCSRSERHSMPEFTIAEESTPQEMPEPQEERIAMKLWINETEIPVSWEENETVQALAQQAGRGDITVSMSMYSDNEQVGPLGRRYPRSDVQTVTQNGDIVLYSGDQIVVFYGSNSWAYTRLGKMRLSPEEVTDLLGSGDVMLRLSR